MIRYFDASALVKRFVREEGTAVVVGLLRRSRSATCRLSEAEISAALARRRREGGISRAAYAAALAALRSDLARLDVIELVPAVVAGVHPLLARHSLRAGDALQLAAAMILRDRTGDDVELVSYDEGLNVAARAEGFVVRPGR